ncbi:MAG: TonB family protein [Candidatus Azobacteroides sp.]|nr:TonB family protein [Candidatus Azobacteroides sp.]
MKDQNKLYGFIGTLIFHGIVLLCLFIFYFTSPVIQESGGVLVNFGNVNEAEGLFEPNNKNPEAVIPEPSEPAPVIPEPEVKQNIISQEIEKTVHIENPKKKEEDKRKKEQELKQRQEQQRLQAEADKQRREEQAKAARINNMAAGAFGAGTGQGSQGSSSGQGNQGNPFGNSDRGSNSGVGGLGGSSFSLQGRSLGVDGLPRPTAAIKEEGRIVVNITVDPKGNVLFAEVGGGTDISDATMRKSAVDAAKKAKFNSITAANNQTGTITYRYLLK